MSVLHNNDDPELNLGDLEDDVHHSPDSMSKNPTFATPLIPSSSVISSPSGLTIDTISRLTHDELQHNAEFMKQLRMVDALQELLGLRERTSAGKLFFCFFVVRTNFFFWLIFFSIRDSCQLRLFVPAPKRVGFASFSWCPEGVAAACLSPPRSTVSLPSAI